MATRKITLKKKVSKKQTRKFSKKGGRKTMKKSTRKQRKSKGGNIDKIKEEITNNNEDALLGRFDSKGITKTAINDSNINELIQYAIENNETSITEFLLTNGTAKNLNIQKERLLRSIDKSTDIEIVTKLVDDSNKQDALIIACEKGNKNAVEMLLNEGVDVNKKDSKGNLILHHATQNQHKDILELLLNKEEINVNEGDSHLETALIHAIRTGNTSIAELLLNAGADINAHTRTGHPVVVLATQVAPTTPKDISMIQFLVEKGADINAKGLLDGETALDKTKNIKTRTNINNVGNGAIPKYLQENGAEFKKYQ